MMTVETLPNLGPMETNIDPPVQEEEPLAGSVVELLEIHVGLNERSHVLKIGKNLENELVEQLTNFLKQNLDDFTWNHLDMVGIHPEMMCHELNIDWR